MRKETPILFSTPMAQAILDGRKSQTRRIIKPQPDERGLRVTDVPYETWHGQEVKEKYKPGNLLWVRESWKPTVSDIITPDTCIYKADGYSDWKHKWKPSIHMPKSACRLWLEIADVKAERLQDISEEGAMREGVAFCREFGFLRFKDYMADASGYGHPEFDYPTVQTAKNSFLTLWQSIHGPESWEANPWVWAISFKRIEKP